LAKKRRTASAVHAWRSRPAEARRHWQERLSEEGDAVANHRAAATLVDELGALKGKR
jgi:hypothetical protein